MEMTYTEAYEKRKDLLIDLALNYVMAVERDRVKFVDKRKETECREAVRLFRQCNEIIEKNVREILKGA